jgi:hypothetical protein
MIPLGMVGGCRRSRRNVAGGGLGRLPDGEVNMINENNVPEPAYRKSRFASQEDKLANASDDDKTTMQITVGLLRRFNKVCEYDLRTQNKELLHIIIEREEQIARTYTVPLDKLLDAHYRERSRETGRSVPELLLHDLGEYHEAMRFRENYDEKVHP